MSKRYRPLVVIWLVIITIISFASLCRTFYRGVSLEIDYLGIIVGILAVLCTILIGWQIYSYIDFNKREERNQSDIVKLRDILKDFVENGNRHDYLIYDDFSMVYENMEMKNVETRRYEMLRHKINAINSASSIQEFQICELGIKAIDIFVTQNRVTLDETQKEGLLKRVCAIPNQSRINNFTDLVNIISSIKR